MSIKDTIQADLKTAMKTRNQEQVTIIRFILAAIKQREIDERKTLSDQDIITVLDKQAKQRRESIQQYKTAGRQELADKEERELLVLQTYLPASLSAEELEQLITAALAQTEAKTIKDMGKVMAILKPQVQGRTDMKTLSSKIRAKLQD